MSANVANLMPTPVVTPSNGASRPVVGNARGRGQRNTKGGLAATREGPAGKAARKGSRLRGQNPNRKGKAGAGKQVAAVKVAGKFANVQAGFVFAMPDGPAGQPQSVALKKLAFSAALQAARTAGQKVEVGNVSKDLKPPAGLKTATGDAVTTVVDGEVLKNVVAGLVAGASQTAGLLRGQTAAAHGKDGKVGPEAQATQAKQGAPVKAQAVMGANVSTGAVRLAADPLVAVALARTQSGSTARTTTSAGATVPQAAASVSLQNVSATTGAAASLRGGRRPVAGPSLKKGGSGTPSGARGLGAQAKLGAVQATVHTGRPMAGVQVGRSDAGVEAAGQIAATGEAAPGDVRQAPVAPAAEALPASASRQITDAVRTSAARNGQQIVVRLNPPELGRVRVMLRSEGNDLRGVLEVESPRTLQQLQREAPALLARLADAGIQLRRMDMSLSDQGNRDSANQYQARDESGAWQDQGGSRPRYSSEHEAAAGEIATTEFEPTPGLVTEATDGSVNVWM